jgi:hypothetical protein
MIQQYRGHLHTIGLTRREVVQIGFSGLVGIWQ